MKHLSTPLGVLLLLSSAYARTDQVQTSPATIHTPAATAIAQLAKPQKDLPDEENTVTTGVSHRTIKVSNKSPASIAVTVYFITPKKTNTGITTTQLTQNKITLGPKASQVVRLTDQQAVQAVEIEPLSK